MDIQNYLILQKTKQYVDSFLNFHTFTRGTVIVGLVLPCILLFSINDTRELFSSWRHDVSHLPACQNPWAQGGPQRPCTEPAGTTVSWSTSRNRALTHCMKHKALTYVKMFWTALMFVKNTWLLLCVQKPDEKSRTYSCIVKICYIEV